ncbi:hypothetical protein Abr02nite_33320 [Paractinoplanes brasiliensis]|nr:hypothetical protein Abr02nite_33320 [Actinoplanes brasiliensis]
MTAANFALIALRRSVTSLRTCSTTDGLANVDNLALLCRPHHRLIQNPAERGGEERTGRVTRRVS